MSDFLNWMAVRHWLAMSIMMPELTLAYAAWMRHSLWACTMAACLTLKYLSAAAPVLLKWLKEY